MQKTILLTGATDGVGLATVRELVSKGHHVLLHGRNPAKLEQVESMFVLGHPKFRGTTQMQINPVGIR